MERPHRCDIHIVVLNGLCRTCTAMDLPTGLPQSANVDRHHHPIFGSNAYFVVSLDVTPSLMCTLNGAVGVLGRVNLSNVRPTPPILSCPKLPVFSFDRCLIVFIVCGDHPFFTTVDVVLSFTSVVSI